MFPLTSCGSSSPNKRSKSPGSEDMLSSSCDSVVPWTSGQSGELVTRSYEQLMRERQPLSERYHGAIVLHRYWQMAQSNSFSAAAAHLLTQTKSSMTCDSLMCGLSALKKYCADNILRVLTSDGSPAQRALSNARPPNAMFVSVSAPGTGVRSYLKLVCEELLIDMFVVGNKLYEPAMMKDLLNEAEASTRALILFDQTTWFSTNEYDHYGVSFIQQLTARIAQRAAANAQRHLGGPTGAHASLSLSNEFRVATLGNTLPRLWVIISTPVHNVHPEVLALSYGCSVINDSSADMAINIVRNSIKLFLIGVFTDEDIETTLSQTAYLKQLIEISTKLSAHTVGSVMSVIDAAYHISYERDRSAPTHGTAILPLLPTAHDVETAIARIGGVSVGQRSSIARDAANMGNGHR